MAGNKTCHEKNKTIKFSPDHTSEERPKMVRFGVASEAPEPLNNEYPVAQKSFWLG